jgi:exopolysaccharide biosynthesis polyprenyl glycosylphosphotransferase
MLQQQVYLINTILMILDALCVIAAGYGAYYFKMYQAEWLWQIDTGVFAVSVLSVMFVNNYLMGKFGLYSDRKSKSYLRLIWSIFKAVLITFGLLSAGIFLFQLKQYSRFFLIIFALLCLALMTVYRILLQLYIDKVAVKDPYCRKILVVGNTERSEYVEGLLREQLSWGHEVIGHVSLDPSGKDSGNSLTTTEDLERVIREKTVDEVVFAVDGSRSIGLSPYIETCRKIGLSCRILPAMWNPLERYFSIETCQGVPFLTIRSTSFNATGLLYKRVLDFVGGIVGTLIFFVMYPIVALAIKIDSPGPVIFKQKRVGKHGRVFLLFKFRTMYTDAEGRLKELTGKNEMNGYMFKLADDPRITRVGRYLRKTSIDEIPQFLNVLKGEMSLVGTRPPTLDEVEKYQPKHLKRIASKPGMTGLWQVSGRNKVSDFERVVELDCKYMDSWRFSNDLRILAQTIYVVLRRKGAV